MHPRCQHRRHHDHGHRMKSVDRGSFQPGTGTKPYRDQKQNRPEDHPTHRVTATPIVVDVAVNAMPQLRSTATMPQVQPLSVARLVNS